MSEKRHSLLIDWGFRLVIVALAILWLVYPPRSAETALEAEKPAATAISVTDVVPSQPRFERRS